MTNPISLFDFQKEDVEKLSRQRNVLIANEMGTGKTYEAIALDQIRRTQNDDSTNRTLVVCPLTVADTWATHLTELTDLTYVIVEPKSRHLSFKRFMESKADVFIVHWEALRLMPELREVYWLHIIADECHKMQNRKAQQTLAIRKLKAQHKTGLSGTPTTGYPNKFWTVLNWLYPKEFSSYWTFYKRYVDYEIGYPQGYHKILGPKNEAELHERIDPFYARRLKKDVLKDLPDKYYTEIWVDMSPQQKRIYDQMKKELLAWVGDREDEPVMAPVVIAQLVRLQQFACAYAAIEGDKLKLSEPSSKLDAVMQVLDDNPDEQIVVFSNFKQLISLLEKRLDSKDIPYSLLTGDVSQADRAVAVDNFQEGKTRVFMGTTQAGGVGITLTKASTVVFLDRNWSPALNQQAEDRLHRIGQVNAVHVIDIMAKGSVDLGRKQVLIQKWDWLKRLLGDG